MRKLAGLLQPLQKNGREKNPLVIQNIAKNPPFIVDLPSYTPPFAGVSELPKICISGDKKKPMRPGVPRKCIRAKPPKKQNTMLPKNIYIYSHCLVISDIYVLSYTIGYKII